MCVCVCAASCSSLYKDHQNICSMFCKDSPHVTVSFHTIHNAIVGSPDSRRGTIMFLHGAPTQSFSYRTVMAQVSLTDHALYTLV